MCNIGAYNNQKPPTESDNASSGGGSNFTSTSSTHALAYLGHILHFINQFLKCFKPNYSTIFTIHNNKMRELLEKIHLTLRVKHPNDFKKCIKLMVYL